MQMMALIFIAHYITYMYVYIFWAGTGPASLAKPADRHQTTLYRVYRSFKFLNWLLFDNTGIFKSIKKVEQTFVFFRRRLNGTNAKEP